MATFVRTQTSLDLPRKMYDGCPKKGWCRNQTQPEEGPASRPQKTTMAEDYRNRFWHAIRLNRMKIRDNDPLHSHLIKLFDKICGEMKHLSRREMLRVSEDFEEPIETDKVILCEKTFKTFKCDEIHQMVQLTHSSWFDFLKLCCGMVL